MLRPLYIAFLRGLIATAEKDDKHVTAIGEIDAIAGAEVDTKLADTVEEPNVAQKAALDANDALGDLLGRSAVAKPLEPVTEFNGLANFDHM